MKLIPDTLRSFISGLGDPNRDRTTTLTYDPLLISDDELLNAYRSSWIAKKVIEIPAMDALRKGRDWQAEKDEIALIEKQENDLNFWNKLLECKIKARLWGGAAIVIGTNDEDVSLPFDPSRIGKGDLKYLTVLSRRELNVSEIEDDPLSEFYDKPRYYTLSSSVAQVDIHPSRLVVQLGSMHPDSRNANGNSLGWGDSVLQSVYQVMQQSDSAMANISNLIFEANVDSFGIPNMMEQMSSQEYRKRLTDRLTLAAMGKSVIKSVVHDAEEEYSRNQITFTGLPDVMQTFLLSVSGAADIPLTRFLGQSPSGLSTTGEGDMKNYYDRVTSMQTLEIQPALVRLDEALVRSALGDYPKDTTYTWTALEQMNEEEQAEVGLKNAKMAEILANTGLFSPDELRDVVSTQLIENGSYPNLSIVMSEGNFDPNIETNTDPNNVGNKELGSENENL